MTRPPTVVLVVDQDPEPRERIAGWLTVAGYDVLTCPGPVAPSYTCVGGRGGLCPLALAAEVVVLNLELASDTVLAGTPALELLCYYLGLGKGVVALGRPGDSVRPYEQERVVLIGRPAEREALLRAIAHQVIDGVITHAATAN
jgi:hypothetical protein